MTRYLLLLITVCLTSLNQAAAQQPSYGYRFKLIGANGKFITDADSLFSISSIATDGSFYRAIKYFTPSGINPTTPENWLLYEYYRDIREFHLIQILNKQTRDTMTFFYKKYYKYRTYESVDNVPFPDSIRFSKGYYIIHERPSLKDWNIKVKSRKLTLLPSRDEFFKYVSMKTNVGHSGPKKEVFYTNKHSAGDKTPAPIPLTSFSNLIFPVHNGEKTGKIVVRFTVDADGKVTNAIPSVKGTTLADTDLNQKCKEAMMRSRLLQPDKPIQSGTVVFHFKSKE